MNPPKVGMYSCGPTVYHYPHIGNLRTYISNDLLKRTLILNGFDVKHVMNITDVGHLVGDSETGEDKMEKGARREGKTVWQIAEYYANDFWDSLQKLNILLPNIVCKATDYIKEMIDLIVKLEQKGYTYWIEDGIYFDTSKLSDYGKLARLDIKGLQAGARIDIVIGKKSITDFALWKFTPSGARRQMEWDSPWGKGFPGWHIECSAMSMKHLGETFDIHTGGIDHIPVHHTNEIAQSEAVTGKQFVRYWIHFAHLIVNGEKMSKSLGNFFTKDDIVKQGFDLLDFRYLCLNTHYRTTMNFSWKSITSARQALNKLITKINIIKEHLGTGKPERETENTKKHFDEFISEINNDLNVPQGLAVLWGIVDDPKITDAEKLQLIKQIDVVLGLNLLLGIAENIPTELLELAQKRDEYRKAKNWSKSDELRKVIENKRYRVEDTTEGTKVSKN